MDDIPKIEFNKPPLVVQKVVPAIKPGTVQPQAGSKGKTQMTRTIFIMLLLLLIGGVYIVFTKIIVWDDGTEIVRKESELTYIPDKLPIQYESSPVFSVESSSSAANQTVKGKITVT